MDSYSSQAEIDFTQARARAFLHDVAAFITRRPNALMSFDQLRRALPIYGSSYLGLRQVPLAQIVGSASNRYADFDRAFLPAQGHTKSRWKRIDELRLRDITLPPVQLYKVDALYFVRDGHHRVSVARQSGQEYTDAEVIELRVRVPLAALNAHVDIRNLEGVAEYAQFLDQTGLDQLRQIEPIRFSQPGGYARLLEHILAHRWFMGIDQNRPVTWEEAVVDWYDQLYVPIVRIIRERRILNDFPGRTEADLYLWIADHHYYLEQAQRGQPLEHAAEDLRANYSPRWSHRLLRRLQRFVDAWRKSHSHAASPVQPAPAADGSARESDLP